MQIPQLRADTTVRHTTVRKIDQRMFAIVSRDLVAAIDHVTAYKQKRRLCQTVLVMRKVVEPTMTLSIRQTNKARTAIYLRS